MINRSARKLEELTGATIDQGSARKFGNIVNRLERSTNLGPSKREEYGGIQNQKPLTSYPQDERYAHFEQRNYQMGAINLSPKSYGISQVEENKKEGINRNREFVAKVENINKIHDQINTLLSYVKSGQSKSLIKQKQNTYGRSIREDETLRNTPTEQKFKLRKQQFIQNRLAIDTNAQQNFISPITQTDFRRKNDKNLQRSYNMRPKEQIEKMNINEERKNLQINCQLHYPERSTVQIINKTPSKISHNEKVQNSEDMKKKLYGFQQLEKISPHKIDQKHLTPKKTQRKEEPIKKYCYNFQTGQKSQQEISKSQQRLTQLKKERLEKSVVNYDFQIQKVRERIQSSEQMTKRMQQKYLGSQQKNTNEGSVRSKNTVRTFEIEENKIQPKLDEQYKNRLTWERKSYLIQSEKESPKNFELQVYPCTIQVQKLRKDQVCRLIAEKISEQVKLDQKLRDARQLFNQLKAADKWQSLQEKLKMLGYNFNQIQLQSELSISSSQSNPFSVDSTKISNCIQQLAQTFAKSEEFWEKKLRKFMSRRTVEKSEFNVREMDLDQRGYLSVEDLVCFANLYTSNFFRNRDIICLFRRMTALGRNRNGVDYDNFLDIICHQ